MWEEYLEEATAGMVNKYQARRAQAKIRQQLLFLRQQLIDQQVDKDRALDLAMAQLGDPRQLARKIAAPDRRQRGWLWLISFTHLLAGVGLLAVSTSTESFAALALGRLVTLWAVLSTVLNTANQKGLWHNLSLLRTRWRVMVTLSGQSGGVRVVAVGALSGAVAALFCGLPWNIVTTNTVHPVLVSESMGLGLFLAAVWGPWLVFKRFVGSAFRLVTMQFAASVSATAVYTILVNWQVVLIPPPLFNWPLPLFVVGSWVFYFAALRWLTFLIGIKERMDPWVDEEIRSAT